MILIMCKWIKLFIKLLHFTVYMISHHLLTYLKKNRIIYPIHKHIFIGVILPATTKYILKGLSPMGAWNTSIGLFRAISVLYSIEAVYSNCAHYKRKDYLREHILELLWIFVIQKLSVGPGIYKLLHKVHIHKAVSHRHTPYHMVISKTVRSTIFFIISCLRNISFLPIALMALRLTVCIRQNA